MQNDINGFFVLSTGSIPGSLVVGFFSFSRKKNLIEIDGLKCIKVLGFLAQNLKKGIVGCHVIFSGFYSVAVFSIWTCIQIICSVCVFCWFFSVSHVFYYSHIFDTACWHCILCITIYWHMHTGTAHFADHDPIGESAGPVMRLYS